MDECAERDSAAAGSNDGSNIDAVFIISSINSNAVDERRRRMRVLRLMLSQKNADHSISLVQQLPYGKYGGHSISSIR